MNDDSIDLWNGPVCDQKNSGRCWIYASLNLLRQRMCERFGLSDFRFSTNYIYFYDQMAKSAVFLDQMIAFRTVPLEDAKLSGLLREPIASAGQWCYFAALAERHGLVPLEAMPDTEASTDGRRLTWSLSRVLRWGTMELRRCQDQEVEETRRKILSEIQVILRCQLGNPPQSILWNGKELSPLEFMRGVCAFDPHAYVMLMHHPSDQWPAPCAYNEEEEPEKRSTLLTMLSVDLDTMKAMALRQLRDGEQVVIGCDVRHAGSRKDGLLDLALETGISTLSKSDAIALREINACHVMSIDGVKLDENGKPLRWKAQDSHGLETGTDGHYAMMDGWFDAYVLSAVVRKEYLPPALRDVLGRPAVYMPKTERF